MNRSIALIDGDSIPYVIAYNNRDEDEPAMVAMDIDTAVAEILNNVGTTEYIGFVQAKATEPRYRERLSITKGYKANRTEVPDWYIKWGAYIKNYLKENWGFYEVDFIESDDAISILAHHYSKEEHFINTVICSNDKDLKQIPGNHYNISKKERFFVTEPEAEYNKWYQVLIGDTSDNVGGLPKTGPVGAEKILKDREPSEYPHAVLQAFMLYFAPKIGTNGAIIKYSEACLLIHTLTHIPEAFAEKVGNLYQLEPVVYRGKLNLSQ